MARMILLDGPMGTELAARGVSTEGEGWSAYALETAPDVVRAIHADYVAAGAMVHRTNTFRTQSRVFPERWRSLVTVAVRLAREAGAGHSGHSGQSRRIAGSIAPVFDCYRPDLSPPEDVARAAHRALAGALYDEGVDFFICETFPHAGEARIAVEEAARTGLETWAALTAGPDGTLMTPEAMESAARDCVSAGARAVLVCCTGARLTLPYVERLARIGSVHVGAYANAGERKDGLGWKKGEKNADRYAALAQTWKSAGATILGACCGTSPEHIAELRKLD